MGAILGDRIAAPDSVGAPAGLPADLEPAVVTLPAKGLQNARAIASERAVVRQPGPGPGVAATPWRHLVPGSISNQWTIVAGLLAVALITAGAMSLRGEPTQTTRGSFEALGLMRSRPPVQQSSAERAGVFSEAEVRLPAGRSDGVLGIVPPRADERPNPATDDRTTPVVVERRDVTAPLTWPIVMSPDTLEEVEEAPADVSTPAQLLSGGTADYPAALRTAGIGGSVEVRFTIAPNGEVVDVRSTTGPPQLRSIAEAAVRDWRYEAARVGNRPVETQTSVSFYFDPSAKIAPQ